MPCILNEFNIFFYFCSKFISEVVKFFLIIGIYFLQQYNGNLFKQAKILQFSISNESILFVPLHVYGFNQYRSSRRPIIDAWECQASIDSLAETCLCARTF